MLWFAVQQVAGAGAKAAQAVVANRVELLGAATSLLYFLSVAKVAERAEAVEVAVGEHGGASGPWRGPRTCSRRTSGR